MLRGELTLPIRGDPGSSGRGRATAGALLPRCPLTPAEFAPLVFEVCEKVGVLPIAAAVGVSFGGQQAIAVADERGIGVPRLVLHSAAPSGLPYPDTRAEAIAGAVLFSPLLQGLVWRLVHRLVHTDRGLRLMMARLSTRPVENWWQDLSAADREEARAMFQSMRSDHGFVNGLRHGRSHGAPARREVARAVRCPALVTGSRQDGGVSFAHAEDLADTIRGARLEELDSPSHLVWIGPGRAQLVPVVRAFLED